MSLPWFRVDNELVNHPKLDALAEELGTDLAGWYVIQLWAWAARYCPRGRLATVARRSFERSATWRGEPGALFSALVKVGFIDAIRPDEDGNVFEIHDWWEKQGAIVEKAEKDRERMRSKRAHLLPPAESVAGPSRDGSKDRPVPVAGDETRRDETKEEALSGKPDQPSLKLVGETPPAPGQELEDKLTDAEFQVFEHWRTVMGHPKAKPSAERKALLARWLKVYSVADLQLAIDGCARTPHNIGQNEKHTRYDGLTVVFKNADNIERFMAAAHPGAAHA